jgi:CheY-like chemotaxis protein
MKTKKILIIDDDDRHLLTARELLEEEGYIVETHNLGFGATNLIKQLKPDLVLLDINMPGLSGDKLAVVIKAQEATENIPIIFFSSNDEDSLRRSVREVKASGYICKGNIIELKTKVAYFLSHCSPEGATA